MTRTWAASAPEGWRFRNAAAADRASSSARSGTGCPRYPRRCGRRASTPGRPPPLAQDLDGVREAGHGRKPAGDGAVVTLGEGGGLDAQGLRQPPLRLPRLLVGGRGAKLALRLAQHRDRAHWVLRRLEGRRQLQARAVGERAAALDVGDAAGEILGAVGPVGLPVRRRRVEQQVVVGAPRPRARGASEARDRGVGVARRDERRRRAAPGERRERRLARGHRVPRRRALGVASGSLEQRRAQQRRLDRRAGRPAAELAAQLGERVDGTPRVGELRHGGVRRPGQARRVRRCAGARGRGPRGRRGQHAGEPRAGAAAMGKERTHRDRAYASAARRATGARASARVLEPLGNPARDAVLDARVDVGLADAELRAP